MTPLRLNFTADWLREKIASDPDDFEFEAGPSLEVNPMSYSFTVRAASKAEVQAKVSDEFDKVVASQSIHTIDRREAEAVAMAFLALLHEASATQDYSMSVHGSLSWSKAQDISSANVGVTASLISKAVS